MYNLCLYNKVSFCLYNKISQIKKKYEINGQKPFESVNKIFYRTSSKNLGLFEMKLIILLVSLLLAKFK